MVSLIAGQKSESEQRILYGVTAATTARAFLRGQLRYFSDMGWDVRLVCGEGGLEDFAKSEGVSRTYVAPMEREPSRRDPMALLGLWRVVRRCRPKVTVFGTPKMGVLGSIAAFACRVPVRIYVVHGFRAEGLSGPRAFVLRALERVACRMSTSVVSVSPSLRALLVDEGVVSPRKAVVLGAGSANGVDLHRFQPVGEDLRVLIRNELGIPADACVLSFVGRLSGDKGVAELAALWRRLLPDLDNAWLVLAGTHEPSGPDEARTIEHLLRSERVRDVGFTDEVEKIYQASDLMILLSKREGLGMVALEAAACAVPTIGWVATGVVDAVRHGDTGVLIEPGDQVALQAATRNLLNSIEERHRLGLRGRERVEREFSERDVWHRLELHVQGLARGWSDPAPTRRGDK
ncbi:glycosyltransferase family 4 protein [Nocardioides sp. HDW12B]|uniref:glycosyltransferase n=1 Tax=Nocardioides sp. HDW12B TaxID=2714939 RepID=UPI001407B64D|nr:glycosyltransferase [Nocardioides sp. HDW12B]QIK64957.1 glycosyltransferase family 4 protein [Nocardioides sp. HDW12B]